ncbi:MAG: DUF4177 domain-containing protein [Terrimicrobiaceae bacterium]|nr:DUF4177 domain-containing protein [Terrimicrobiaceae bacterium]
MNKHLHPSQVLSTNGRIGSRRFFASLFAGCVFTLLFACGANAGSVKWEYRVLNAGLHNRQLESLLNSNGAEGWELVQINAKGVAILKRRK